MDARLRKRRGVLRVSASRHIGCSVRRRPFGSTPFFAALANLFLAAHTPQMRPSSGWMRCTPQPYLQQPYSLWDRQHSPTALAMRRAVRSVLARRVPSSPYPSTSGGKSLILKRVAENRAPYSRFRFQDVSKTATHLKPVRKPVRSRAVTIDARLVPLKPLRFKNRHLSADVSQTGDLSSIIHVFKAALAFVFQNSSK